jgi:tetratricopeptide (TPR) repeat protein
MTERQEEVQKAMSRGVSAAWDQDWDKAATFYRQVLVYDPNHSKALTSLGMAFLKMENFQEALKCYKRASEILPDDPLVLENIAKIHALEHKANEELRDIKIASDYFFKAAKLYLKRNEPNKAIDNLEKIVMISPQEIRAREGLARVYEHIGEQEKAIQEYLTIASLLQARGNQAKTLFFIDQAKKINPEHKKVINAQNLIKDFKQLPRPVITMDIPETIPVSKSRDANKTTSPDDVVLDPILGTNQMALQEIADILFDEEEIFDSDIKDNQQSSQRISRLRNSGNWLKVVVNLSQAVDHQTQGENEKAIIALEQVMEFGLVCPSVLFNLGYLYYRTGRNEKSYSLFKSLLNEPVYALGAYLIHADMNYQSSNFRDASIDYLQALKLAEERIVSEIRKEDLYDAYSTLIEGFHRRSSPDEEARLCENIRDVLIRDDWKQYLGRARKQLPHQHEPTAFLPLAEIILDGGGSQVIESMTKISEMTIKKQFRSAMEESYRVLDIAPYYLPLHALMVNILVKQNEIEKAIIKLRIIAITYRYRGEFQQAINYYRRIIELSPADLQARNYLIRLFLDLNQTILAIQEYVKLAEVYYRLADLKEAREVYIQAYKLAQEINSKPALQSQILSQIADIDMQNLDWRQALRNYEQMRALVPDDIHACRRIVEMHFRLGQEKQALAEIDHTTQAFLDESKMEVAINLLENITEEFPNHIPVRRRLADLYKQFGREQDMIRELDMIGELLLKSGDRSGAKQIVEMIVGLNPPNKADYLRLLDGLQAG